MRLLLSLLFLLTLHCLNKNSKEAKLNIENNVYFIFDTSKLPNSMPFKTIEIFSNNSRRSFNFISDKYTIIELQNINKTKIEFRFRGSLSKPFRGVQYYLTQNEILSDSLSRRYIDRFSNNETDDFLTDEIIIISLKVIEGHVTNMSLDEAIPIYLTLPLVWALGSYPVYFYRISYDIVRKDKAIKNELAKNKFKKVGKVISKKNDNEVTLELDNPPESGNQVFYLSKGNNTYLRILVLESDKINSYKGLIIDKNQSNKVEEGDWLVNIRND